MEIKTNSGMVKVNKRTPYGKWLMGYCSTDAWSGWWTLEHTWREQKDRKPTGCSWYAWGVICGSIIYPTYSAIKD